MVSSEQIKAAKLLGKHLRNAREEQGFNLAILAAKLKLTVVQLVAIEDGNLYPFDKSIDKFSDSARLYAAEMGLNLPEPNNLTEKIQEVTAKEWDIAMPQFLLKKD